MKGATLEQVDMAHTVAQPAEAATLATTAQPTPAAESAAQVTHRFEHFVTPEWIVEAALSLVPQSPQPGTILDAGAGTGVWGKVARVLFPGAWIVGIDLDGYHNPPPDYSDWEQRDFLGAHLGEARGYHDLVMSNPPFSLAEAFIRRGLEIAHPDGGRVVMLLRLAFLEGQKRGGGLWKDTPLEHVAVLSARPSFTGNGKTDSKTAYAIFVWRNGYVGQPTISWVCPPAAESAA